MILALDTATVTGWAAGNPGERPQWGSRHFIVKGGNGEVIAQFRHWLEARCDELRPDLVVFESPWVPRGLMSNALTLRRLMALAVTVEAVAWERRIKCREATPIEIAKFFIGTGGLKREAKKAATIEMCRRYGFDVSDDNSADALALWCMAEARLSPAAARDRGVGPLFLKNDAPRKRTPAGRGRRVQTDGYPDAQQPEQFSGSTG